MTPSSIHKCNPPLLTALAALAPLLLLLLAAQGFAACIDYGEYLHVTGRMELSGQVRDAAIAGSRAYLILDDFVEELAVVDLSEPFEPILLGSAPLGAAGRSLAVAGDHAYVAAGDGGVLTFAIDDPGAPALIGTIATTCPVLHLTIEDGLLYAVGSAESGGCSRLEIYSLSDPAAPQPLGGIALGTENKHVAVVDGVAYVSDFFGSIQIVDVSSPASPALLTEFVPSGSQHALTCALADGVLYSAWTAWDPGGCIVFLMVVDVSDPGQPVQLGVDQTLFHCSVGSERPVDFRAEDDLLYVQGQALQVFDTSDPADVREISRLELAGYSQFAMAGGLAIVPDEEGYLNAVDVGNPLVPELEGGVITAGNPWAVAYREPYAYVTGWQSFQIFEVSDPAAPQLVSGDNDWWLWDIALDGDRAYATSVTGFDNALWVLDIGDPAAPALLGACDLPLYAYELDYRDGHVYVAVGGDIAYLARGQEGLQIVDVGDPAAPASLGFVDLGDACWRVCLADSRLYANPGGDLAVLGLADPFAPEWLGSYPTNGLSHRIAARDGIAAVANIDFWLELLDVSDPTRIRPVGSIATPGGVSGIALGEESIYLADGLAGFDYETGFQIAPMQCDLTGVGESAPPSFSPIAVYPNPFNPRTTFRFELAERSPAYLEIFAVSGRRVAVPLAGRVLAAGAHELSWEARDDSGRRLPSGVYLYRLTAGGRARGGKLMLLK